MITTLGYWKPRGLAQPIRFLLEYVGEEYQEKFITSHEQWQEEKFTLGLTFPNLPYYIDGDVKLTQSSAIIKYLAMKHNLFGKPEDIHYFNMIEGHLAEHRWKQVLLCVDPAYSTKVDEFIKVNQPNALKMLSDFLCQKKWLFDKLSYMDFLLYEFVCVALALDDNALKAFPNLMEHKTRFENMDKIKAYMNSPRFSKYPFHGSNAVLG